MRDVRYVKLDTGSYSIRYRGEEFAHLWRHDEGGGWWTDFWPVDDFEVEQGWTDARRNIRAFAEQYDLYLWWGLRVGAKEG